MMNDRDQLNLFAPPTATDTKSFHEDGHLGPLDWGLWACGNCGVITRLADIFANHNPDPFWTTASDQWTHRYGPPIIVGEAPGPNTDRRCAMYPLPPRSAGGRLCAMLDLTPRQYLRRFHRANLMLDFPGKGTWDAEVAGRGAGVVGQLAKGRVVFACGRKVVAGFARAFSEVPNTMKPLESIIVKGFNFRLVHVPHPSGRNQWYNDPASRTKVRGAFHEFAGWVFDDAEEKRRDEYARDRVIDAVVQGMVGGDYTEKFIRRVAVPVLHVEQFSPYGKVPIDELVSLGLRVAAAVAAVLAPVMPIIRDIDPTAPR